MRPSWVSRLALVVPKSQLNVGTSCDARRVSDYRYSSLTAAIDDPGSPLRQYLERRFPNRRDVQTQYRTAAGPQLVPGSGANPGTLGAAFDYLVRFTVAPDLAADAMAGFATPVTRVVVREMAEVARSACNQDSGSEDRLGRACWSLALCTEVYRLGMVWPGSVIDTLIEQGPFQADELLAAVPEAGLDELLRLDAVAKEHLFPVLPESPSSVAIGPTFEASRLCHADADLVVDGLLLELKTRLGAKDQRTGERRDSLSLIDLYQLLGYVLFDRPDELRIREVGFYSARFGHLQVWPVEQLLNSLAMEQVDLAAEREHVWQILGGEGRFSE